MHRKALISSSFVLVALVAIGWPPAAQAQHRGRGGTRVVVARGFYGPFYSPFYSPFYDPWFGPQWGWGYPYGGWRVAPPEASVRLDIKPRDAQVYVDGYFAGEVDQFDGAFQRLRVAPGQHEIVIYKEGYKSIRERLYLPVNTTRKLSQDLDRLAAGEPNEPLPEPRAAPEGGPEDPQDAPPPPPRRGLGPRPGSGPPPEARRSAVGSGRTGTIALRVQPGDATILIDGERWTGGGEDDRLIVQLAEGQHQVEVEKDGYRRVTLDVQVRRGETSPVNVSLSRE